MMVQYVSISKYMNKCKFWHKSSMCDNACTEFKYVYTCQNYNTLTLVSTIIKWWVIQYNSCTGKIRQRSGAIRVANISIGLSTSRIYICYCSIMMWWWLWWCLWWWLWCWWWCLWWWLWWWWWLWCWCFRWWQCHRVFLHSCPQRHGQCGSSKVGNCSTNRRLRGGSSCWTNKAVSLF